MTDKETALNKVREAADRLEGDRESLKHDRLKLKDQINEAKRHCSYKEIGGAANLSKQRIGQIIHEPERN